MRLPRMAVFAAVASCLLFWTGCGDTFRPVANPITGPGGDPSQMRLAVILHQGVPVPSTGACFDASAPPCPGATMEINVSGDTNVGNYFVGRTPVHLSLFGLSQAFIANQGDNSVSTYSPIPSITPGGSPTTKVTLPDGTGPVYIASINGQAYVAGFDSQALVIVNGSGQVLTSVPLTDHPVAVAVSPDNTRLFVAGQNANEVTLIAAADNAILTKIPLSAPPVFILSDSTGAAEYVLLNNGTVAVITTATNTVATTLTLPSAGANSMAFDPQLLRLYVANPGSNTVSVFDASTTSPQRIIDVALPAGAVLATLPGTSPALAPTPDGSRVYVLDAGSTTGCAGEANRSRVSVINSSSNTVTKCVTVPPLPVGIAVSSDSAKVYVPHQGTATDSSGNTIQPGTTIISTANDQVSADLPAPFENPACTADGGDCVRMKPIFVVANR